MKTSLSESLRSLASKIDASEIVKSKLRSEAHFFEFLEKIDRINPWRSEVSAFSWNNNDLTLIADLPQLCQVGFGGVGEESRQALEEIMYSFQSSKPQWVSFPYARSIAQVARRWLDVKYGRPSNVSVLLSPSIDIGMQEDGPLCEPDPDLVILPFVIINTGGIKVRDISVWVEVENNDEFESLGNIPALESGESSRFYLRFAKHGYSFVIVNCKFRTLGLEGYRYSNSSSVKIDLSCRDHSSSAHGQNPFIPDLPLVGKEWEGSAKGIHHALVESLLRQLSREDLSGRVFAIRGVKRSGKTSVLLRLIERARESGIIPVYIDVRVWALSLQEEKICLGGQNLLYELAGSAIKSVKSLSAASLLREFVEKNEANILSVNSSKSRLYIDIKQFCEIMRCVVGGAGESGNNRSVAFFLDDLDWFLDSVFEGSSRDLLTILGSLSREETFKIILVHEWIDDEWRERYREHPLMPEGLRCRFIDLEDVRGLASLARPALSELELSLIWALTGGWPGLVQLLLYVVQEANEEMGGQGGGRIKRAVSKIIHSHDYHYFLSYLLESFSNDEKEFLKWLANEERVDDRTAIINGMFFELEGGYQFSDEPRRWEERKWSRETLLRLATKQILEPVSGQSPLCRLRVGLLSCKAVWSSDSGA